ncbi:MAG: AMP-binding protein [Candidatus Rokubacteria bacterium]|nr:AMP-binding protein [Candidatus Rokubacteria bacterium]
MEGDLANVAAYLSRTAEKAPSRPALLYPRGHGAHGEVAYGQLTFRELDEESDRYAHGLSRLGIGRGCRVLLMVPPGVEFIGLTFAIFKMGAVLILIDPGMGGRNLLHCIREVEPEGLVAVPLAHALRRLCWRSFPHVRCAVTVGRRWFWGGATLAEIREPVWRKYPLANVSREDPAAILFTTGSTGVPKGVLYLHGMFDAQIRLIQSHFAIDEEEVGLPAFAPFALFSVGMGTPCVLPSMDPTRPAHVDPRRIIAPIHTYRVTYSFGSPAFWNRVSQYCVDEQIRLPSVKQVTMAGAPVSSVILRRLTEILPPDAETYTPYGATEALPVTSISGAEILGETAHLTSQGAGICVGRALPGVTLRIIEIRDEPIPEWNDALLLPAGQIGEIVVKGAIVTREYYNRQTETALAKIREKDAVWHRMGDVGYLDEKGRLWFCGRKGHRVITGEQTLFTVRCEAIFNQHPDASRSALVGVGPRTRQRPVIVIEPKAGKMPRGPAAVERFRRELLDLGSRSELAREIQDVLFHPAFPVDFRHNAKILREKLAVWAEGKLR